MHQHLLTAEEFADLPEVNYQEDLIRGVRCFREPWPKPRHGIIQGRIQYLLYGFAIPRRLGEVMTDVGFVLETNPDTVCAPDVSFVTGGRICAGDKPPYPHGAPELAVEVLSSSNSKKRIAEKIELYLRAGARLVWCVDPRRRTVAVYRPHHEPVVLREGDVLSGEDVLPGFQCRVAEVFDPYWAYGTDQRNE